MSYSKHIVAMISVNWRLFAATVAGAVLVVSAAIALDLVGRGGAYTLVPTAIGLSVGYVIHRRFSDGI